MEISGKVLREVEFRDRLRGYDTDEVDEFLEKVAVAVDDLRAELSRLEGRSEPIVRQVDEAPALDEDAIGRTLVLAQRAADLALSEARQEAVGIVADARQQSEKVLAQASEAARRVRAEAEQEIQDRVDRLQGERERLESETAALVALLNGERERLTAGLSAALRFVEETLSVSSELHRVVERRTGTDRPGPERELPGPSGSGTAETEVHVAGSAEPEPGAGDPSVADPTDWPRSDWPTTTGAAGAPSGVRAVPDVESEISEDAAKAAPRGGPPGEARGFNLSRSTSPPPALDADDALWAEWAAGGSFRPHAAPTGLGALDEPFRFDLGPGGDRPA